MCWIFLISSMFLAIFLTSVVRVLRSLLGGWVGWCAWLVLDERVEFGLDVACGSVSLVVGDLKVVEGAEDVGAWCFW